MKHGDNLVLVDQNMLNAEQEQYLIQTLRNPKLARRRGYDYFLAYIVHSSILAKEYFDNPKYFAHSAAQNVYALYKRMSNKDELLLALANFALGRRSLTPQQHAWLLQFIELLFEDYIEECIHSESRNWEILFFIDFDELHPFLKILYETRPKITQIIYKIPVLYQLFNINLDIEHADMNNPETHYHLGSWLHYVVQNREQAKTHYQIALSANYHKAALRLSELTVEESVHTSWLYLSKAIPFIEEDDPYLVVTITRFLNAAFAIDSEFEKAKRTEISTMQQAKKIDLLTTAFSELPLSPTYMPLKYAALMDEDEEPPTEEVSFSCTPFSSSGCHF